jgi:hypothetical protein
VTERGVLRRCRLRHRPGGCRGSATRQRQRHADRSKYWNSFPPTLSLRRLFGAWHYRALRLRANVPRNPVLSVAPFARAAQALCRLRAESIGKVPAPPHSHIDNRCGQRNRAKALQSAHRNFMARTGSSGGHADLASIRGRRLPCGISKAVKKFRNRNLSKKSETNFCSS